MIPQNKGKDIENISPSKLIDRSYYYSTKFDGNYCQIKYNGEMCVTFTSSGNKQFYIKDMANYIIAYMYGEPFHIECEYTNNCVGKLGDRVHSAKLTTYRTEFAKGQPSFGNYKTDNFYVLDRLDMYNVPFKKRLKTLDMFDNQSWFTVPNQTLVSCLKAGILKSKEDYANGFEGGMLKSPEHFYQPGKRTNDIIKLKPRRTADLLCIGIEIGEGKYTGMIGSLFLQDRAGRIVSVGSGLTDWDRNQPASRYIGKVIEIGYEQILGTYIQPVFIYIRDDKKIDFYQSKID